MRVFFVTGITLDLVTAFLSQQAFAPLISQSNSQFGIAVSMSFTIAMLVLGMSYLIAHFIRFNVVELKSALTWYVLAALFFQLGPELYLGMNSLRSDINSFFYATALQTVNGTGSPLAPLHSQLAQDGQPMLPPCDNFGWLSGNPSTGPGQGVDGLDIGMAYLLATARDVLGQTPASLGNCSSANPGGYPANLPFRWYHTGGYFDQTLSPPTWEFITEAEREQALALAAEGQYRLMGVWPLLWLGLFEKLVYLLVTFAQGLSFISFGVAAIFAFFKRTEAIARSVVDLCLEIIVSSVVIALGQSLIVSLALAAAATQNPLASLGVGLLCAVLMLILLLSATKLVWNALTRIFGSISQATGGAMMTPQQALTGAAVGGIGTVAAIATGGGALALAGAAMSGMSASGVGGQALGMAGGQLMLAGRMTGARRMTSASGAHPLPAAVNATAEALIPTHGGAESAVTSLDAASPPIPLAGYEAGDRLPDSPLGQRTSRIQAQFTPLAGVAIDPSPAAITNRQSHMASAGGETAAQTDAAAQARLNADNVRDDAALRHTVESDHARAETVAQARLEADNSRDDAVLPDTLKTSSNEAKMTVDTSGLERAGRDLSGAAGALKALADQQHLERVMGQLEVSGGRNVGAVVADAVDIERDYRQKMNKPMLEGAGDTFGGRMAQAVGVQPMDGQTPITDPARFNAVGDQALRLGLSGGQVMQVMEAQANAPDGRSVAPEFQAALVRQIRTNTGARQS
jgi:hypothetical protein